MEKPAYLFITILAVILLAGFGCDTTQNVTQHTGTQGLVMSFAGNAPPLKAYHGDEVEVSVDVWNKGASTVEGATFYLSGYDTSVFPSLKQPVTISKLEGTENNPYGGYDQALFGSTDVNLFSESYSPTFMVTACYNYKTIASAPVCVDTDPTSTRIKVCTPSTVNLGSQGAPIAVSKIEVESAPGVSRFKIYFTNPGGGDVFTKDALTRCDPFNSLPIKVSEKDMIDTVTVSLHGQALTCQPKEKLRLYNNQAFVVCTYNEAKRPAYTSQIKVELEYAYSNQITKTIQAVKLPGT